MLVIPFDLGSTCQHSITCLLNASMQAAAHGPCLHVYFSLCQMCCGANASAHKYTHTLTAQLAKTLVLATFHSVTLHRPARTPWRPAQTSVSRSRVWLNACKLICKPNIGATRGESASRPADLTPRRHCQTLIAPSTEDVSRHSPAGCMASEHTTPACAASCATSAPSTSSQKHTRPAPAQAPT